MKFYGIMIRIIYFSLKNIQLFWNDTEMILKMPAFSKILHFAAT